MWFYFFTLIAAEVIAFYIGFRCGKEIRVREFRKIAFKEMDKAMQEAYRKIGEMATAMIDEATSNLKAGDISLRISYTDDTEEDDGSKEEEVQVQDGIPAHDL